MLLKAFFYLCFMFYMTSNFVYSQIDSNNYNSLIYLHWANDLLVQTDYYFSNGVEMGYIKKSNQPIFLKQTKFNSFDHFSVVQDFFYAHQSQC